MLLKCLAAKPKIKFAALPQSYAYAFKWDDYLAPKMLNSLLEQGVKARVALSPLTAKTPMGEVAFEPGSILVPAGLQTDSNWVII